MQSLIANWSAIDARRRFIVILATIAVFASVLFLARAANTKDLSLLFGGLEPAAAGDVIAALEQQGAVYEVRGNAIFVDSNMRDSLRMSLAGEGLPASGGQGYELLDSMSGFGTTAQMFDAAYLRAKEGELARTIVAGPHIRTARVHISTPNGRPFQRDQITTAAVTVQTTGGSLSVSQIKALQFLIAASVSGLSPDDVAVIDADGGLLSLGDDAATAQNGDNRAEALRQRAERLLAARVGPGNAVVEVTVETINETESISERMINPDSRVAISTDVQESTGKSEDSRGGDVTVASNLPDGAAAGGGSAQNENSETRSLTNFEVSQTQRDVLRAPGAVRRLTVAVLVNDVQTVAADGTVTSTPRTQTELDDLQTLVSSAVGLDEARGDVITLRAMSFEPLPELGTEAISQDTAVPLNMMQLIQVGVLAAVALILGLFVVKPILSQSRPVALPAPKSDGLPELGTSDFAGRGGTAGPALIDSFDADYTDNTNDPVTRLRDMIASRESETIQILQDWIEEPKSKEEV